MKRNITVSAFIPSLNAGDFPPILLNYHLIWCPKRRKLVLMDGIKERLEQIIKEVAEEKGIGILDLVINPDHVHLFASANPMVPAHGIVKDFKGRSSRLLRQEFPELLKLPSLCYFVSTLETSRRKPFKIHRGSEQEMIRQKTVKAKIFGLTRIKEAMLREEYDYFQAVLRGVDAPLYSATRQQAERLLSKIRKQNRGHLKRKEYPMILRRDVFNIRETENKLARFWVKIPVHYVRGGIKVPIQVPKNQEYPLSLDIREGKLLWKGDHWSLQITVMKEVEVRQPQPPSTVLAVDLGERYVATSVVIADGVMKNPKFYGKQVRGIRRHYAWLRRRLGERKLLTVMKRIGNTEKRKVNAILHKVSREIVNEAEKQRAAIVLGVLKGIRNKAKGKRMNRIVSNMPYYRLMQMITYKALWEGIPVYKISERNTSKTCYRCGNMGERLSQARFKCPTCGLDYFNADLNGAINIAERFSLIHRGERG